MADYDIITVGGGLGASSLGKAMAQEGARVLVLERETAFRDRVRGEQLASWGADSAQTLGVLDDLVATCAHEAPYWDVYIGAMQIQHRAFAETTPSGLSNYTFYHPAMQETLLQAAAAAGAEVQRGVRVSAVRPGDPPEVDYDDAGRTVRLTARLVVGADGRTSNVRKWSGFSQHNDGQRLQIAGVLLEDIKMAEDALHMVFDFQRGRNAILFPQGGGRVRGYLVSWVENGPRLNGDSDVPRFIEACIESGVSPKLYEGARASGPLATFSGADSFVPHPCRDGVALVGDAAATSDPSWGQGLSLTLRDARTLRDCLVSDNDWNRAGNRYADQHDAYYGAVRTSEDWFTQVLMSYGTEADARRARALPAIAGGLVPDTFQSGPDGVDLSENSRKVMFGEA